VTLVRSGDAGGRAPWPRARPHGSPVAASSLRTGRARAPHPPRGLGRSESNRRSRARPVLRSRTRRRLAMMARPRPRRAAPGVAGSHGHPFPIGST
jgi:hypothetical protein